MEDEKKEQLEEINKENKGNDKLKKVLKEISEWIICFIIAYIIYLVLNYFLGTISGVKQVSMLPTAKEGERLLIQRPTIFKRDLKHGDIITFEAPLEDNVGLEADTTDVVADYEEYKGIEGFMYHFIGIGKMTYIKRVIGLPGDNILITDEGEVYRNGNKLEEPYLKDGSTSKVGAYSNIVVPDDTVFVMGDNRFESKDSRYFGCIPISKVNGYVICRIWPFNRLGKV